MNDQQSQLRKKPFELEHQGNSYKGKEMIWTARGRRKSKSGQEVVGEKVWDLQVKEVKKIQKLKRGKNEEWKVTLITLTFWYQTI
jgi:hypothetical protein